MCRTVIHSNYFIEYSYTEDGRFKVTLQELKGSDKVFTYIFRIIKRTPEQQGDLIEDAIFWHEQLKAQKYVE